MEQINYSSYLPLAQVRQVFYSNTEQTWREEELSNIPDLVFKIRNISYTVKQKTCIYMKWKHKLCKTNSLITWSTLQYFLPLSFVFLKKLLNRLEPAILVWISPSKRNSSWLDMLCLKEWAYASFLESPHFQNTHKHLYNTPS